jgi:hypothetical protein
MLDMHIGNGNTIQEKVLYFKLNILSENPYELLLFIIIIIIISYSPFTCFSWYFSSWTSGEPHHSGFNFLIVALSL